MSITDAATLVSPAFIIGGFLVVIARWLWMRFEVQQEQTRKALQEFNQNLNSELLTRLDAQDKVQEATLNQAKATNGRVTTLENEQRGFEREHSVFRERLSHVEGQTEVLLREKGQPL